MNNRRPKILFTSPEIQHPPAGGPYLRIENSIKALHSIADVYLHARVNRGFLGGKQAIRFYRQYSQRLFLGSLSLRQQITLLLARLANRLFRTIFRAPFMDPVTWRKSEEHRRVLSLALKCRVNIIWLGYGNISYDLLKYLKENSQCQIVLDTDSVWSRFLLRGVEFARTAEERAKILQAGSGKQEEERWGTQNADVTTAVSKVDAEYYRSLVTDSSRVHIFSNVIDVGDYENPLPPPFGFKRPCLYLAGYFGPRSPMDDAARWFMEKVWPQLTTKYPDLHFYIVGKGSKETLHDISHPSVTITGQLETVLPYLCNADISLVPLRFESGTRFKILEAGACGIPIVSTTLGAEGINVTHGKDIWIADTPEEFIAGISKMLTDRDYALRIGKELRKNIQNQYGLSKLRAEGQGILHYLAGRETKIG